MLNTSSISITMGCNLQVVLSRLQVTLGLRGVDPVLFCL